MRIICHTLHDITKTGVNSRTAPNDIDPIQLQLQRSQQSNFETILQIISMRGQPEDITNPVKHEILRKNYDFDMDYFGYLYHDQFEKAIKAKAAIHRWSFSFTVNHSSVFNNGIDELGNLYDDCQGVPIITRLTEWSKLGNTLDTTDEMRNIYFRIAHE
jgi:hypothetical protein